MAKINKIFLQNYAEYKDKIFAYFLYRVNFNRVIAEDLTSEVFLKALENFPDFDQTRPFQAWIYTIAANHLKNYYRICNREVSLEAADGKTEEIKDCLDAKLELERVMDAIMTLDDYYREVLLLRFVDGLGNAEIADLLDKEEGAVRAQISRALAALREKIGDKK
jgi:RNA polymerase sigma factor (sigma-70 family)